MHMEDLKAQVNALERSARADDLEQVWMRHGKDDSFEVFQWPGGCATSQARGGAAGGRGPGHSESREGSQ